MKGTFIPLTVMRDVDDCCYFSGFVSVVLFQVCMYFIRVQRMRKKDRDS